MNPEVTELLRSLTNAVLALHDEPPSHQHEALADVTERLDEAVRQSGHEAA